MKPKSLLLLLALLLTLTLTACKEPPQKAPYATAAIGAVQTDSDAFYDLFVFYSPALKLGKLQAPVCDVQAVIKRREKDCFAEPLTQKQKIVQLMRDERLDGFTDVDPAVMFASPSFRLGSYNVLGASHTEGRHANRGHWPDSPGRMRKSIELMRKSELSLVGLQEFQPRQYSQFRAAMPNWGVYPGLEIESYAVQNSIVWDTKVWTRKQAYTIAIPYFGGKPFKMPYVLLEHNETKRLVWVGNFHNPANTRGKADHLRARAVQLEAELARTLSTKANAVIVTGDMNDREEFFCPFTAVAPFMHGSNGSVRDETGCVMAGPISIDWITGSNHLLFSNHVVNNEPQAGMFSDHPLILSDAQLEPFIDREKCHQSRAGEDKFTFCPTKLVTRITRALETE